MNKKLLLFGASATLALALVSLTSCDDELDKGKSVSNVSVTNDLGETLSIDDSMNAYSLLDKVIKYQSLISSSTENSGGFNVSVDYKYGTIFTEVGGSEIKGLENTDSVGISSNQYINTVQGMNGEKLATASVSYKVISNGNEENKNYEAGNYYNVEWEKSHAKCELAVNDTSNEKLPTAYVNKEYDLTNSEGRMAFNALTYDGVMRTDPYTRLSSSYFDSIYSTSSEALPFRLSNPRASYDYCSKTDKEKLESLTELEYELTDKYIILNNKINYNTFMINEWLSGETSFSHDTTLEKALEMSNGSYTNYEIWLDYTSGNLTYSYLTVDEKQYQKNNYVLGSYNDPTVSDLDYYYNLGILSKIDYDDKMNEYTSMLNNASANGKNAEECVLMENTYKAITKSWSETDISDAKDKLISYCKENNKYNA